ACRFGRPIESHPRKVGGIGDFHTVIRIQAGITRISTRPSYQPSSLVALGLRWPLLILLPGSERGPQTSADLSDLHQTAESPGILSERTPPQLRSPRLSPPTKLPGQPPAPTLLWDWLPEPFLYQSRV